MLLPNVVGFAPLSALELAYFAFVKDFREHLPQYRDLGYLERWCTLVGSGRADRRERIRHAVLQRVLEYTALVRGFLLARSWREKT
jgi:hypothetical protein